MIPDGYTNLSEQVRVLNLNMEQPIALASKLEYHLTKVDVHYVFSGEDEIHLKRKRECVEEYKEFSLKGEFGLFSHASTEIVILTIKDALYIRPETAPMALCGTGNVWNVVF